jgi:hypothetical protein
MFIRRHPQASWSTFSVCVSATLYLTFYLFPVISLPRPEDPTVYTMEFWNFIKCLGYLAFPNWPSNDCKIWLSAIYQFGFLPSLIFHLELLVGAAALIIFTKMLANYFTIDIDKSESVIRGRRVSDLQGLKFASRKESKQLGAGVEILPGVCLSRDREVRHLLTTGSVGGGKTQVIKTIISPALKRGDRALIADMKGDFTSEVICADGTDPLIIAPHDRRSAVWDIAADLITVEDSEEFAAKLYPVTGNENPMWSQGAAAILTTCIVSCQVKFGRNWGWSELRKNTLLPLDGLIALARENYPDALLFLQSAEQTTAGFLSNFSTQLKPIKIFAKAWAGSKKKKFSVRKWMIDDKSEHQIVILQRSTKYPALSNAWMSAMLNSAASTVGSPDMTESRDRRIWIVIDEFAQLPKMNDFSALLDLGRSKGVSVFLGTQDKNQIKKTYGPELAASWDNIIGTQIICRMNTGASARDISDLIGDQEVEFVKKTSTSNNNGGSEAEQKVTEKRKVITPDELGHKLGPCGQFGKITGIKALFLGIGRDVYIVTLPLVKWPKRRPEFDPARWTTEIDSEEREKHGNGMELHNERVELHGARLNPNSKQPPAQSA